MKITRWLKVIKNFKTSKKLWDLLDDYYYWIFNIKNKLVICTIILEIVNNNMINLYCNKDKYNNWYKCKYDKWYYYKCFKKWGQTHMSQQKSLGSPL